MYIVSLQQIIVCIFEFLLYNILPDRRYICSFRLELIRFLHKKIDSTKIQSLLCWKKCVFVSHIKRKEYKSLLICLLKCVSVKKKMKFLESSKIICSCFSSQVSHIFFTGVSVPKKYSRCMNVSTAKVNKCSSYFVCSLFFINLWQCKCRLFPFWNASGIRLWKWS